MGLFDIFRKKPASVNIEEKNISNSPELLMMTLLYKERPSIDSQLILNELKKTYPNASCDEGTNAIMFSFPDIMMPFSGATIPAQCSIMIPNPQSKITLPDEVFQQNWHWPEATETAGSCKYEILLTDLMSRELEYKARHKLYMDFLVAVIKQTNPDVVCSSTAQKLIPPGRIVEIWETEDVAYLVAMINVRMYNITNSPGKEDMIMDTVGLHTFGLPDLQVRFSKEDPNDVGLLLWNYAYYIFDNGDIILDGNTVTGPVESSRWKCMHESAMVQPARWVINIVPQ